MGLHRLTQVLRASLEVIGSSGIGKVGFIMLMVFVIIGAFADVLAPYDPEEHISKPYEPPTLEHPFGTDNLGRDLLSRVIYGVRASILIGVLSGLILTVIGVLVGLTAGYFGGYMDLILMGLTDLMLTLPPLPLIMVLAVILGKNFWTVVIVIAVTSWPQVARLVRSMTVSIREYPYVEAAKVLGAGNLRILLRHILPNVVPLTISQFVVSVSLAVVTEAGLAFLGLRNPLELSLGIILYEVQTGGGTGSAFVAGAWWWILFPGLLISLITISFAFLGYAIDVATNPRLRRV